jgi:hypothetical protein
VAGPEAPEGLVLTEEGRHEQGRRL